MHVSALPGDSGIGDLGSKSHAFIDFLHQAGQSFWQILPLGPVSPVFDNSPYMTFSAFAGNPLFISAEPLLKDGLLQKRDLSNHNFSEFYVIFEEVINWKKNILNQAWKAFQTTSAEKHLDTFIDTHTWVRDYALFMALKEENDNKAWFHWPKGVKQRNLQALSVATDRLRQKVRYFTFEQYIWHSQWQQLHEYAKSKNIRIIGDLPIYVGLDSVDVWANQQIFKLNQNGEPTHVAGVPPDYFSKNGQRWGNPLYRWNSSVKTVQDALANWWENRFATLLSQVDVLRIDHFRGFEAYWSIPAAEKTAIKGTWEKGPGKKFFLDIQKKLGPLPLIAEDLGTITSEVEKLRNTLGYPGMKILLFAFDGNSENAYLPYNHCKNCVVYTGTHDNDTAVGWFLNPEIAPTAKKQAKHFANCQDSNAGTFHLQMIYLAHSSRAGLSILPMQDVLGFGNDCRFNTPGTTQDNWKWRCPAQYLNETLANQLYNSTLRFGRIASR